MLKVAFININNINNINNLNYHNINNRRQLNKNLPYFTSLKTDVFERKTSTLNFKSEKKYQTDEIATFLSNLGKTTIRNISPTLITGGVLESMWEPNFAKLKDWGLETVIDLRKDTKQEYKIKCSNTGIEYFNFPINNIKDANDAKYYVKKGDKLELAEEFVKNLKEFFDILSSKNVYMGCQYGVDRTNTGLFLNYFLNPNLKTDEPFKILSHFGENDIFCFIPPMETVSKILRVMTNEQKKFLGIEVNDEFRKNFNKKMDVLLAKNNMNFNEGTLSQFRL